MTKPITDKAEVALEYPDRLYVGTFERSSRFEAHLDPTGIALLKSGRPTSARDDELIVGCASSRSVALAVALRSSCDGSCKRSP